MSRISLGVLGSTPPELLRELAARLEAARFYGLWLNAPGSGDPLAGLAAAASVTSALRLGIGVLPVDTRTPEELVDDLSRVDLPRERVVVGVGAGAGRSLTQVSAAVEALHEAGYSAAVGGLGPRMRALAARTADGLLLNWLPPALAAEARAEAVTIAQEEGRTPPRVALYVRTVLDARAEERLRAEARRYEAVPSYAANFTRHGITALETTLVDEGAGIGDRLDDCLESVDEVVLRAITPGSSLEDYLAFVDHPDVAARL